MRLFGRNASQMSTKQPDALDVPPELRPYYREQAVSARTRHAAVQILTVTLVIGLVLAAGGLFWVYRHGIGDSINRAIISMTTKPTPKQSTGVAKNNNQDNQKAKSQNNSIASNNNQTKKQSSPPAPTPPSPTPTPAPAASTPAPSPTPSSGSTSGSQSSTQQQSTPPAQPPAHPAPVASTPSSSASSSIPNTGPGTIVWVGALLSGVSGFVLYQLRLRRVRL
jgi:hypothetical protein